MKTINVTAQGLWRAWRARRDERAFEDLVAPELRYASDFARRLGASPAEAEDLVQDTLVLLARETSEDPVEIGLRAWLCRRVMLRYRMHVRAAVRRRRHERRTPPHARRGRADPTRPLELRDEVESALAGLAEDERRTVLLRYLHDLDYREISYVLGITENACRIRVHKALGRLKARLGKKAGALVAVIGVPPVAAKTTLVSGALATASASAAVGTGVKVAGALALAAAAITAAVVVDTDEPEPPPPIVASAEPGPAPAPPAPPAPEPGPLEPNRIVRPGLDLLTEHFEGKRDATKRMWRFDGLRKLVRRPDTEARLVKKKGDVTDLDLGSLVRWTSEIRLGPGVFRVSTPIPAERCGVVEIRGAGKDRTLLLSPTCDLFDSLGEVDGFVLRDLTIESDGTEPLRGGGVFFVRGQAVGLFRNVRFRNWETDAGIAAPVGVSSLQGARALLGFQSCEFLGAYRRPRGGAALGVRGDTLALFEKCRFYDLEPTLGIHHDGVSSRSLVHFRDCSFFNSRLAFPSRSTSPQFPIRVKGARVAHGLASDEEDRRLRDWGRPLLAVLERHRTEGAPVRCTLRELRLVLSGYTAPAERRVTGIEVMIWEGCADSRYALHLLGPNGEESTVLVRRSPGGVIAADASGYLLPRFPSIRGVDGAPSILEQLVAWWARYDPEAPVGGIFDHRDTAGNPVLTFDARLSRSVGAWPRRR